MGGLGLGIFLASLSWSIAYYNTRRPRYTIKRDNWEFSAPTSEECEKMVRRALDV